MRKGQLLVGIQFACLAVIIFFPGKDVGGAASAAATLLELVAAIILVMGFLNLRDSLKITPEPKLNAKFVTHGIYKYIRHPIYSGLILFAIAEVINKQSLSIEIAALILVIDLVVKFKYEDQLLRDAYPEAVEYQKRVGALFPKP
jgi:protein-S-isoprenylcysteine O-methyltransferase Ste14